LNKDMDGILWVVRQLLVASRPLIVMAIIKELSIQCRVESGPCAGLQNGVYMIFNVW
jgi:hypothetical protein